MVARSSLAVVAEILTDQIIQSREKGCYLLHDFCVMPNHLHVLLTPAADSSLERTIQMIKGGSSYRIGQQRRIHTIWQDGYHDWRCRSESDFRAYADYIRENPVKAGLVAKAEDWAYSSANPKYSQFLDHCPQGLKAERGKRASMSTLKG